MDTWGPNNHCLICGLLSSYTRRSIEPFPEKTMRTSTSFLLLCLSTTAFAEPEDKEAEAAKAPTAEAADSTAESTELNMPKDPAGAKADLAAAAQAHSAGKWDEVEAKANAAVVKDPELADAWVYRALALEQKGEHEMASQVLHAIPVSTLGEATKKLHADGVQRIDDAIASKTGTRGGGCRTRTTMSLSASRAWLDKASRSVTQLNSCAGKFKRMACNSRSSMSDVRDLARRCVAAAETLDRVSDLGCRELHDSTAFRQLVVMGQVVYLFGQIADADKCMQRRQ
jgi:tetratricopeptide (TPR) repeat protein